MCDNTNKKNNINSVITKKRKEMTNGKSNTEEGENINSRILWEEAEKENCIMVRKEEENIYRYTTK